MRRYHPLSLLPIETLFLLSLPSASASSINYINYQPAVQIQVANSGPGANAGSSSGAGQGSSGGSSGSSGSTPSTPASVPFSPATPPICPASHVSCDTIGEPSWCCTDGSTLVGFFLYRRSIPGLRLGGKAIVQILIKTKSQLLR